MRRVLFDENLPKELRRSLPEFAIRTVQEEGLGSLQNGHLLRRAEGKFDVLVTADRRMLTVIEELRTAIRDVEPGELLIVEVKSNA